ncbi:hypothetical protein LCGC14_0922620 [marine sediment metagenome]|uniref:Uncharacterized protein n=1 Tax=marine sediment metagenome TaxID=412755 RepID=A0A0F9PB07_9ZZZZ
MYTKGKWERKGNKIEAFGKGTIAVCPSPTTDRGVLEFIANAHLIAQAPRMYEALGTTLIHPQSAAVDTLSDTQCRAELKRVCDRIDHFKDIANETLAKAEERE